MPTLECKKERKKEFGAFRAPCTSKRACCSFHVASGACQGKRARKIDAGEHVHHSIHGHQRRCRERTYVLRRASPQGSLPDACAQFGLIELRVPPYEYVSARTTTACDH